MFSNINLEAYKKGKGWGFFCFFKHLNIYISL